MDLEHIEPALCALVAQVTGIEASCVVFENAPRPRFNTFLATLSWVSIVGAGVDETQWDFAADADPLQEMTPSVVGQRKAVLQISVVGLSQLPGQTARAVLELARTRMQAPSSLAALRAVELAFAGAEAVLAADYVVDGRWHPRATLDVHLNAVSRITDAAGRSSYIATVGAVSTIQNPDGTTAPASIQPGGILP